MSVVTPIDNPDRAPIPEERLVLDGTIQVGADPETRRRQLLRYVREHYVRPTYGSPVSTIYCESPDDVFTDELSLRVGPSFPITLTLLSSQLHHEISAQTIILTTLAPPIHHLFCRGASFLLAHTSASYIEIL